MTDAPTSDQLAIEQRQREATDTFIAAATAAAPRWFDNFSWTFRCPSGDWTQGRATLETLGGEIALTFVGRSERWCVEATRGGHSLLLRSDVPDADLGRSLTKAWRAMLDAQSQDQPHGLGGPNVPFPAGSTASLIFALVGAVGVWMSR